MIYDNGSVSGILGSSGIKILSDEGGFSSLINWQKKGEENKAYFDVGSIVDSKLVQDKEVDFFVIPKFDENGKKFSMSKIGKAEISLKRDSGLICISERNYEIATRVVDSLNTHPLSSSFFDKGNSDIKFQQVFKKEYELENGDIVTLRATPDIVIEDDGKVVAWCDLKTTMSLNHAQFLHQFKKLKYRIQAALYTDIMAHNGADFSRGSYLTAGYNSNILYIAASTKEDHIFMTEVSESTLKEGMIDIKSALLELSNGREKKKQGEFFGYKGVMSTDLIEGNKTLKKEALKETVRNNAIFM